MVETDNADSKTFVGYRSVPGTRLSFSGVPAEQQRGGVAGGKCTHIQHVSTSDHRLRSCRRLLSGVDDVLRPLQA